MKEQTLYFHDEDRRLVRQQDTNIASRWQNYVELPGSTSANAVTPTDSTDRGGAKSAVEVDAQGRVTIPQRLRESAGIRKEVVVLGVRDRMEIWDREAFERYQDTFAGAYRAGSLEPRRQA